jgi:hypothetical protein
MGDRFVYLVPFGAGPLDPGNVLGVSAMPPRVITVSDHGQPVGFPATLTAAPVFANDVAASAGPGVSALLAWLRGADLGLEEPAPAPVELRFTGRF